MEITTAKIVWFAIILRFVFSSYTCTDVDYVVSLGAQRLLLYIKNNLKSLLFNDGLLSTNYRSCVFV